MARVTLLQITPEKGSLPRAVPALRLTAGEGIEGDWHRGRADRAVCIQRREVLAWMEAQEMTGACFRNQKANILIKGLEEGTLVPGARLRFREAVLEISPVPKYCFSEECALARQGIPCLLRAQWQMARILTSGVITTGETVEVV